MQVGHIRIGNKWTDKGQFCFFKNSLDKLRNKEQSVGQYLSLLD